MPKEPFEKSWAKIVAKAWTDEKFKKKLLENPDQVLRENGIDLPKGTHIEMHENSSKILHFALPEKPSGKMSEEELRKVAGGGQGRWDGTFC